MSISEEYLFSLVLRFVVGWPIGAYLNRYTVDMWLIKHKSVSGPAKIFDGTLKSAAVGIGTALLPALAALFCTNHLEMAKAFIIITYIASAFKGGIIGTVLAAVGGNYIKTE